MTAQSPADIIEFARALARAHVARDIARHHDAPRDSNRRAHASGATHADPDLRPL